jgi:hypothetical protein
MIENSKKLDLNKNSDRKIFEISEVDNENEFSPKNSISSN